MASHVGPERVDCARAQRNLLRGTGATWGQGYVTELLPGDAKYQRQIQHVCGLRGSPWGPGVVDYALVDPCTSALKRQAS